jgi:hypothetical protein
VTERRGFFVLPAFIYSLVTADKAARYTSVRSHCLNSHVAQSFTSTHSENSTLIKKEKKVFLTYREIQMGSVSKSYMTNDLLIYGENICAFPHILGSPSSYMTMHPIPSEFPYI